MYQIIQTQSNEHIVVDRSQPHPFSGYRAIYRIQQRVSSHWENGTIWAMTDFSIEQAKPFGSVINFWEPLVGKTTWAEVRATLAKLLHVAESDIAE